MLIFSLCSCSLLLWLQMINLFIVGGILAKTEEIGKLCKIFDTVCALLIFNGSIYKSLWTLKARQSLLFQSHMFKYLWFRRAQSSVFCFLFPSGMHVLTCKCFLFTSKMVAITYTLLSFILNLSGKLLQRGKWWCLPFTGEKIKKCMNELG